MHLATTNLYATGPQARVTIGNTGNVGIGTTAPAYPLDVNISARIFNTTGTASDQMNLIFQTLDISWINYIARSANPGNALRWWNSISGNIMTLLTNGALQISGALSQNSDRRIKKDIRDLVDEEALDILRQIKPMTYRYVDPADRGLPEDHPEVIGFIAQDIAAVLPNAVSKKTQFVPSVMSGGTLVDVDVISIHNSEILPFEVDARVNIRWTDVESGKIKHGVVRCTEIDVSESTFRFVPDPMNMTDVKPEEFPSTVGMEVFVRGHEVDDFHVLDKSAIFTVAAAATQELDRQLQAAKSRITDLETQVAAQNDLLASMNSRLAIMDDRFATVNDRLAALESQ